jgi:hypothetical protein
MKNYLLSALVCSTLLASAQQSLIPTVWDRPVTGFNQLVEENPYMLQQQMVSGQWANFQRFTHQIAPNVDHIGESITSQWQASASEWKNVQIQKDSFVLDGQNRISVAIEEVLYDYGQFTYQAKNKYQYTYDANNAITFINVMSAVPANSNNYTNSWTMSLFYNPDGSRNRDSMYYYSQQEVYVSSYNYNPDGSIASNFGFNEIGDTISKAYFSYYTPTRMRTNTSSYLDETSDTWETQNADSFTYDAEGNISGYISWGIFFDGTNTQFAAITNDSYHYSASGKLDEIITRTWNSGNNAWDDDSKTTILYNPQDKAVLGNIYASTGSGGWESTPTYRYLFDVPTGIANVYGSRINASVYPNPTKDIIIIKLENQSDEIKDIKLFDLKGKSISPVVNADHTIDLSSLNDGIYSLLVITENGASVQKISVQH